MLYSHFISTSYLILLIKFQYSQRSRIITKNNRLDSFIHVYRLEWSWTKGHGTCIHFSIIYKWERVQPGIIFIYAQVL